MAAAARTPWSNAFLALDDIRGRLAAALLGSRRSPRALGFGWAPLPERRLFGPVRRLAARAGLRLGRLGCRLPAAAVRDEQHRSDPQTWGHPGASVVLLGDSRRCDPWSNLQRPASRRAGELAGRVALEGGVALAPRRCIPRCARRRRLAAGRWRSRVYWSSKLPARPARAASA